MKTFRPQTKVVASCLLVIGCYLSGLVPAAKANLIVNGSFENPTTPQGGWSILPAGWIAPNGGSSIIHPPDSLGPLYPPAQDGAQYELMNGGDIGQVNIPVTAGQYLLTWFDNTLTDRFIGYQVYMYNSLGNVVASTTVAPFHGATSWNARSLSMTLPSDTYSLRFGNAFTISGDVFHRYYALDNVNLSQVIAPVPDGGSSAALLSMACAGIFVLRRRWF